MKNKLVHLILVSALFVACSPEGVEKEKDKLGKEAKDSGPEVAEIDKEKQVRDSVKLENGIVIKWYEHGKGPIPKRGEVVAIDYKVYLKNGEIIDGNHLLNKKSFPFPIGFQQQGKGWDLALAQLRVGDFAEFYLPSKLARGDKSIEGLLPANSDNIVKIRILEKIKPTRNAEGNKVWIFEEDESQKLRFNENSTIVFHTMISSPSNPIYGNTFAKNQPFTLKLEDYGVIPGLKKALINAKSSDRMLVYIPSSEAYGSKGYLDVVKPNEDLLYNVMVMDVIKN